MRAVKAEEKTQKATIGDVPGCTRMETKVPSVIDSPIGGHSTVTTL